MPRSAIDREVRWLELSASLDAWNAGRMPDEALMECLVGFRAANTAEENQRLDELLMLSMDRSRRSLLRAREDFEQARKDIEAAQLIIDSYGNAPLIPAIFLGLEGDFAMVANSSGWRAVAIAKEVQAASLKRGDRVLLSADQSVLAKKADWETRNSGEIATFEKYACERLILKTAGNGQIAVHAATPLAKEVLRAGDTVLWDRPSRICLEKIDDARKNPFLVEEIKDLPLDRVGGQQQTLQRLQSALMTCLIYSSEASEYDLEIGTTILLYGPPGSGKTFLTRATASEIKRLTGKKVYFAVVNGSSWSSPFVGVTEANITSLFASLRSYANEGHAALLFIDEIDSVGRIRGESLNSQHADRSLNTLLTELDGFHKLNNVSVIGACNRKDLIDPALISRFAEMIPIRRPNMKSAREIFSVHLSPKLPYVSQETREAMIDLGVSKLYAPNAVGEICTLKLQDGKTRPVLLQELVSARTIAQVTASVRREAFNRGMRGGRRELGLDDLEVALADLQASLLDTLSPRNAHSFLENLATDQHVIGVEPILRRPSRTYEYVNPAA